MMKKYFITTLVAVALIVPAFLSTPKSQAACSGGDEIQLGKLDGTITITDLDGDYYDDIYVSDESWNEAFPSDTTSENFEIVFRDSVFSGKGWSEDFGWVDFSYGTSDTGLFTNVNTYSDDWGGWTGNIEDLDTIQFKTSDGTWAGQAVAQNLTLNDLGQDVYVGVVIDFDITAGNLAFLSIDDDDCPEYVDLFINGAKNLNRATCPISAPSIKWTSQNIDSAIDCTASGALWNSGASGFPNKSETNTSGETAGDGIDTTASSGYLATPQTITLTCTGDSGNKVVGTAVVSCGNTPTPDTDIPIFQEV